MREFIGNDGAWELDRAYQEYLARRREAEEAYFKAQGIIPNNTPEEHDLVNEEEVSDPIVQSVIDKFRTRHFVGMKTYGMTMADNPAKMLEWINHAQDELMDAILYLERLKKEVK